MRTRERVTGRREMVTLDGPGIAINVEGDLTRERRRL
jgi:hypothetical protein